MNQETQNWIDKMKRNFDTMVAEDKNAQKKKQLVGRYVALPQGDGRAYYKIVKENKMTVKMEVVTDIGDDWEIPYWGPTPTISKNFAINNIEGREALEKIFS